MSNPNLQSNHTSLESGLDNTSFSYQLYGNIKNSLDVVKDFLDWDEVYFKGLEDLHKKSWALVNKTEDFMSAGDYTQAAEVLIGLMQEFSAYDPRLQKVE
jgi:hypothetical protein